MYTCTLNCCKIYIDKGAKSLVVESVSILAISICMVVVFLKAGHADYALSLTPIMLVPFTHIAFLFILRVTHVFLPTISYRIVLSFADMAALAVASILLLFFSYKIKSKRNKKLYIVLLCGYNIVLTCAYVYQTLQPLMN